MVVHNVIMKRPDIPVMRCPPPQNNHNPALSLLLFPSSELLLQTKRYVALTAPRRLQYHPSLYLRVWEMFLTHFSRFASKKSGHANERSLSIRPAHAGHQYFG